MTPPKHTPREWWIDINEWMGEDGAGGMAFNRAALDEMEMSDVGLVQVLEATPEVMRAVNSHYALVEALAQAIDQLKSDYEQTPLDGHAALFRKLDAALARARGEG